MIKSLLSLAAVASSAVESLDQPYGSLIAIVILIVIQICHGCL